MAVAYDNRCEARLGNTQWGRCIVYAAMPHDRHRDEACNNFIVDDKGVAHVVDLHGRWLS